MIGAFEAHRTPLQLSSRPTALLSHADQLYLATQQGALYVYSQAETPLLVSSNINLAPSIDALDILREANCLVILSAGNISLYHLSQFTLQSSCTKWTKAQASSFSLQSSVLSQPDQQDYLAENHPSDSIQVLVSLLAVPCKRRLVIFCWRDSQWLEPKEIYLPHQVRSLVFPTPLTLFLGYSTGHYATVKLGVPAKPSLPITHHISDPFPSPITHLLTRTLIDAPSTSSSTPLATNKTTSLSSLASKTTGLVTSALSGSSKLAKNSVVSVGPPTNEVIAIKEQIATFLNHEGKLSRPQTILNSIPSSIIYPASPTETISKTPYVLSLLPHHANPSLHPTQLLVHSIPTLSHLQTLPLTHTTPSDSSPSPSPSKKTPEPPASSPPDKFLFTSAQNMDLIFFIGSHWNTEENSILFRLEYLKMKPWSDQIQQLIDLGEYRESLALVEGLDEIQLPHKVSLLKRLHGLCALLDFMNHKYDQAIDQFIQLSINPVKLVALYPEIISGTFHRKSEEWDELYGGRSKDQYLLSNASVGPKALRSSPIKIAPHRSGSDVGSKPASLSNQMLHSSSRHSVVLDDDSRSIRSFQSTPVQAKQIEPKNPAEENDKNPTLDSNFRPSVEVLIRYLTDRRQQVNKRFNTKFKFNQEIDNQDSKDSLEGEEKEESKQDLFQLQDLPIEEIEDLPHLLKIAKLIDTSLFKCYLAVRPTMLGPLCRLPNWCQVDLVEGLLMDAKRYHELLDLYHGKAQHDRALKLLKKMAMNEEDVSTQIEPTIRYLQKLGPKYIDLILQTSKWVFSLCCTSPSSSEEEEIEPVEELDGSLKLINQALEIFTADLSTVESLPRTKIVKFLEILKMKPTHNRPIKLYLEFIIYNLKDQTREFHEKLIQIYIVEYKHLKNSLSSRDRVAINLDSTYGKLLEFLLVSDSYSSNWVLGRLPQDDMFQARALTLGKMGQHEAALIIYVRRLGNLRLAEEYCKRVYAQSSGDGSIFLLLLKIYLRPSLPIIKAAEEHVNITNSSSSSSNNSKESNNNKEEPEREKLLEAGIKLINDHGNKIESIEEIIQLLPNLINLNQIKTFLNHSLIHKNHLSSNFFFLRNVVTSRLDFLSLGLASLQNHRVKIDTNRLCVGCGKRLGNSVIAVHPPYGEVTHYQCQERLLDPKLRRL